MSVSLRLEVNENDAAKIIEWLKNKNVTKYLNEDINSIDSLEYVIKNKKSDLLTYYLNQDGRFFLVDSEQENCIGFINLFTKVHKKEYEIVIVIGDEKNWGKQYGRKAIESIMREVFLNWRIDTLHAKIHAHNERSINLFEHLNFSKERTSSDLHIYSITFNKYFEHLTKKKS